MFLITAQNEKEFNILMEHHPDGIILALSPFSIRQNSFIQKEALKNKAQLLHGKGIGLYINAMRMLMEEDLEEAREFLSEAKDADVDGIYVADEGYLNMAMEMDMIDKMIYQPETLVVNGQDADFYQTLGVQAVSLAHELSIEEIEQAARYCGILEVLVQGHYSWMYSRRPLISNYLQQIGSDLFRKSTDNSDLGASKNSVRYEGFLQEVTREEYLPVSEDQSGTIIFSGNPIQSFSVMDRLKSAGINRYRIDTMFHNENYGASMLELYRKCEKEGYSSFSENDLKTADGDDGLYYQTTVLKKEKEHGKN